MSSSGAHKASPDGTSHPRSSGGRKERPPSGSSGDTAEEPGLPEADQKGRGPRKLADLALPATWLIALATCLRFLQSVFRWELQWRPHYLAILILCAIGLGFWCWLWYHRRLHTIASDRRVWTGSVALLVVAGLALLYQRERTRSSEILEDL